MRTGIGGRIAIAGIVAAVVGIAILTFGVLLVGGASFETLMLEHGESADAAHAMFDASISIVVLAAAVLAIGAAIAVATVLGRRLAAPLRDLGEAAARVASGDLSVRVEQAGPPELAVLAGSFNRMAADLAEQERLRRDFIVGAAHELRTPLTNLTGYLEALRDGVISADREAYASLLEETERLTRLAASLDTLADGETRPDRLRVEDLDLAASVRAAAGLAGPAAARAELRLTVEVTTSLVVRADPDAVAQVLANLLQNAVRYTPAGGHITVSAMGSVGGSVGSGGWSRVEVVNDGPGIPAADLAHVFERFYRVEKSRDRARGGAGIGLAIVRDLVEAMGGAVGAASRDGETRFWLTLPMTT